MLCKQNKKLKGLLIPNSLTLSFRAVRTQNSGGGGTRVKGANPLPIDFDRDIISLKRP